MLGACSRVLSYNIYIIWIFAYVKQIDVCSQRSSNTIGDLNGGKVTKCIMILGDDCTYIQFSPIHQK